MDLFKGVYSAREIQWRNDVVARVREEVCPHTGRFMADICGQF